MPPVSRWQELQNQITGRIWGAEAYSYMYVFNQAVNTEVEDNKALVKSEVCSQYQTQGCS